MVGWDNVFTPKGFRHIAQRLCFFSRVFGEEIDLGSGSTNGGRKRELAQAVAVLQGVSVLSMVLRIVSSLRMQATSAALKALPCARSR
jgi:hypothetical protein